MGGLTGVITGATGVFVIPAVPWLQTLGFRRDELVQALGLSFTLSTLAMAAGLSLHDGWHADSLLLSGLALLPALLGMWLGQWIRSRLSPRRFRQGFLLFFAGAGNGADRQGMADLNPLAAGNVLHVVLTGVLVDL